MRVRNVHQRRIDGDPTSVGRLIDTLASPDDRLWPRKHWPRMRFADGLTVGAKGGHGPLRYEIERYAPGSEIVFRFISPRGFHGTHGYSAAPGADGGTLLVHEIDMRISGIARLSWPLVFRPLHDALMEDSLDLAEQACTPGSARRTSWSPYVKLLRRAFRATGMGRQKRRHKR